MVNEFFSFGKAAPIPSHPRSAKLFKASAARQLGNLTNWDGAGWPPVPQPAKKTHGLNASFTRKPKSWFTRKPIYAI
jgi:hypothetical protein